jgi:hypothetical protein
MNRIVDVRKAQAALDKAAIRENRTGRFTLKANMPYVESSMMRHVDYDEGTNELDITFEGGKTYRYFKVPHQIYDGLLKAESKGEFFNEHIKNLFGYNQVVSRSDRRRSSP